MERKSKTISYAISFILLFNKKCIVKVNRHAQTWYFAFPKYLCQNEDVLKTLLEVYNCVVYLSPRISANQVEVQNCVSY